MKKKILILTPDIPYPLSMGGNVAQFYFSEYLVKYYDVTYIFQIFNSEDEQNVQDLLKQIPSLNVINIYNDQFIRVSKNNYLKRFFRKLGNIFSNLIVDNSVDGMNSNSIDFRKSNPIFQKSLWYINPISEIYILSINNHIKNHRPDLVQVEHSKFLVLSNLETYNIPKIFIHHELQYGMLMSAASNHHRNPYTDFIIETTKGLELTLLKKYNEIIVFSIHDKEKLENNGLNKINVLGFPIMNPIESIPEHIDSKIQKLVFIGGDIHYANVDAIKWYVDEIGEDIYHKHNLKLHIIGNWNSVNRKLFNEIFIVFEGFVDDLNYSLKNSIQIIPLRMGGGIRTKVLTSMAYGNPIISTALGVEGIGVVDGIHYILADDKIEFINKLSYLVSDKTLMSKIVYDAHKFVKTHYSVEFLGEKRRKLYERLMECNELND